MEAKKTMHKPSVPFGILKAVNEGQQVTELKKVGDYTFEIKKGRLKFVTLVRRGVQSYDLDFNLFDEKIFKKMSE